MPKYPTIWFSIIEFSYQTEHYIMITNDLENGDAEIAGKYDNDVYYEMQFDGPEHWAQGLQMLIKNSLEELQLPFLDHHKSPCYYKEDVKRVKDIFEALIKEFNEAYAEVCG